MALQSRSSLCWSESGASLRPGPAVAPISGSVPDPANVHQLPRYQKSEHGFFVVGASLSRKLGAGGGGGPIKRAGRSVLILSIAPFIGTDYSNTGGS